jgi:hypothetical protein
MGKVDKPHINLVVIGHVDAGEYNTANQSTKEGRGRGESLCRNMMIHPVTVAPYLSMMLCHGATIFLIWTPTDRFVVRFSVCGMVM